MEELMKERHMRLFREYDMRGFYPEDINSEVACRVAKALTTYLKCRNVAISRDSRRSGKEIADGLIRGFTELGVNVIDLGMNGTDFLYFSVGYYGYDAGVQITASHMPKDFNGMKIVGKNAHPIAMNFGLEKVKKIYDNGKFRKVSEKKGKVTQKDITNDFINSCLSFIDLKKIKPFKVVFDAGNGVGGLLINKIFKNVNCDIMPLNFDPDGHFPVHDPNPFLASNRKQIVETIKTGNADFGVAFDGDADRTIFIDENGNYINGEFIVGVLAAEMLKKKGKGDIIHESRAEWFIRNMAEKYGGNPVRVRCGHAYFKNEMNKRKALFGGEKSGHIFYNFDNFMVDNALIPILQIMEMMSKYNKKFSEIFEETHSYHDSLEMNFDVTKAVGDTHDEKFSFVVNKVEEHFTQEKYGKYEINRLDTLSVDYHDWRFNLRPSANDPVLRLNIEAKTKELLENRIIEMTTYMEKYSEMLPL